MGGREFKTRFLLLFTSRVKKKKIQFSNPFPRRGYRARNNRVVHAVCIAVSCRNSYWVDIMRGQKKLKKKKKNPKRFSLDPELILAVRTRTHNNIRLQYIRVRCRNATKQSNSERILRTNNVIRRVARVKSAVRPRKGDGNGRRRQWLIGATRECAIGI
jgi:hypothetical protein